VRNETRQKLTATDFVTGLSGVNQKKLRSASLTIFLPVGIHTNYFFYSARPVSVSPLHLKNHNTTKLMTEQGEYFMLFFYFHYRQNQQFIYIKS
jgi:hypothetical protein